MSSSKPKKKEDEPFTGGGGIGLSKSKPITSTSRSPAKHLPICKASFAFGSSTPRELSHINRVSRESRLIDTSPAKGGSGGGDEHDILYYMRQARSKTPGGSGQSDGKSKCWAFGSSTPREFSHLSRMRASERVYDAKLKAVGDTATTSLGLSDSKSATFQRDRLSSNNHTIPRSSRSKSRTPGGNTSKMLVARPSSIDATAGNAATTALSENANSEPDVVHYRENFCANAQTSEMPVRTAVAVDTKKAVSSQQQLQKQSNNTPVAVTTKSNSSPHQPQPTTSSIPPPPLPPITVSNNNNTRQAAVQLSNKKEEPTDNRPNLTNNKPAVENETTTNQRPSPDSQHNLEMPQNNDSNAAQDKSVDDKAAPNIVVQTLEDILKEPLSTSTNVTNNVVVTQEQFSKVEIKADENQSKVGDEKPTLVAGTGNQPTVNEEEKLINSNYVQNQKADQMLS